MYRLIVGLGFVGWALLQFHWNNVADAIFYICIALYISGFAETRAK